MSFVKKTTIFLLFFLALFFLVFIRFFWHPDILMGLVSGQEDFYLHFDLNSIRRAGKIGNDWLKNTKTNIFLEGLLTTNENSLLIRRILENKEHLDEVGLIGFKKEGGGNDNKEFNLVFLLKIKQWTDPSLIDKQIKEFAVKKINRRVWMVSLENIFQQDIFYKNSFKEKFSFSLDTTPFWIKGHFYPEKTNLNNCLETKVKINCFSFLGLNSLFFNLKIDNQKDISNIFLNWPKTENRTNQEYVLIYLKRETMESFENKIKTGMAVKNPVEKTVFLPDGTSYVEQIIDPNVYEFINKTTDGLEIKQLTFQQDFEEIFLYQDQNYFYLSNGPHLFKTVNGLTGVFKQDEVVNGFYYFINNKGARDLTVIETRELIKGILRII